MNSQQFTASLASQLQQLKTHPHVQDVSQIQPLVYKISYWPQNLQSIFSQKSYNLKLVIPENYPQIPPKLYFLDKLYHLNIHPTSGQVYMPLLKDDWSPYLGLKAIIQSLDTVLQEADENCPATNAQLKQYIQQMPKYVSRVKKSLHLQQQQKNVILPENQSNETVEQIIQVTQYLKKNKQLQTKKKNQKQEESNKKNNKKEMAQDINAESLGGFSQVPKNEQNKRMLIEDEFIEIPVSTHVNNLKPEVKMKKNENQSKVKQDSVKELKQQINKSKSDGKNQTYQNLKQTIIKTNQLMDIFSQECEIIQSRINKTTNTKIKKVMQQKIVTLQNTILQLFELASDLNFKIMQIVKKESRNYI